MRISSLLMFLLLSFGCTLAADIVTMPTANQLKKGQVDLAAYYLNLDMPAGAPQFVNYQTLYVGVTDWLELDVHHADVNRDEDSFVFVASAKLLSESPKQPDVVVGIRNFTNTATTLNPSVRQDSKKASYYLSTAKTFFLTKTPGPPLARVHLSVGTEDFTLLGEKRHEGLFGGVQLLLAPTLGAVLENDGTNLITGLTYMPNKYLTIKGGTYGRHQWIGVSYLTNLF